LTGQTNGGRLTVVGTTTSAATNITVNLTNAAAYGDFTFAAPNMPLTSSYTAIAKDSLGRRSTNLVTVNLSTNSAFKYDLNGNLTNDGLRNFVYDDENQMVEVLVTNQWMSQFQYDGKMRRRIRKEFTWTNSAWAQTNAVFYVYDGNLVIQERDQNNLPTVTYTRGKDLSGSLEGAGGIGGLLARTDVPLNQVAFYHADANGNVTMLINSTNAIVAKYLYDAFGNVLSQSGSLAAANLYRFSSKETHTPSGLDYYLYRFYDPNFQRWPNRDPIADRGFGTLIGAHNGGDGMNLYTFAKNDGVDYVDLLGLMPSGQGAGQKPSGQSTGCQLCQEGGGGLGAHHWIEGPGGSYGFYPGPTGIWHGPGQIQNPDPHSNDPNKDCHPINFNCGNNCDSSKFQQCMANEAKSPPGNYCVATHNCHDWADDAVNKCKKAACQ
jgi:RHS repeat-associated protein